MVKISSRLKEIANLIEDNSNILDIGCDHALLDIYLLENKNNINVIASDILESAVDQAENNINKYHMEDRIDLRLGDGLNVLKKEDNINTIVISGMGFNTIMSILKKNKLKLKGVNHLIIQSNNYIPAVRKEICKLGYYIKNEKMIIDNNKLYIIILFERGHNHYSNKQYLLGPVLSQNKDQSYLNMINDEIKRNALLLKTIPNKYIFKKYKIKKYLKILISELT